jgi:hypothetical protein
MWQVEIVFTTLRCSVSFLLAAVAKLTAYPYRSGFLYKIAKTLVKANEKT